jgi:tRNA U34 5-carboxymethylaminomethyl modifying GTPase MnmE/TrmE
MAGTRSSRPKRQRGCVCGSAPWRPFTRSLPRLTASLRRLLLGLQPPTSGKVLLDGNDMSNVNMDEARRHFGVVLQDVRMFAGSILENISAGRDIEISHAIGEITGGSDSDDVLGEIFRSFCIGK